MNKKIVINQVKDWKQVQKNKSYDNFIFNPKLTISGDVSNIPPEPQPTIKDVLLAINVIKDNQEKDHKLLVNVDKRLSNLEVKVDKIDTRLTNLEYKVGTVIKVNCLKTK